jgi:hypothetical protein
MALNPTTVARPARNSVVLREMRKEAVTCRAEDRSEDRLPERRVSRNSEGQQRDCPEITDAPVVRNGYARVARKIAIDE